MVNFGSKKHFSGALRDDDVKVYRFFIFSTIIQGVPSSYFMKITQIFAKSIFFKGRLSKKEMLNYAKTRKKILNFILMSLKLKIMLKIEFFLRNTLSK